VASITVHCRAIQQLRLWNMVARLCQGALIASRQVTSVVT
jgi:hypothetical protein